MYMIEIKEDKLNNLVEHMAKGAKYIHKAIECLEELKNESGGEQGFNEQDYYENERPQYRFGGQYGNMRSRQSRGRYGNY